MAESGRWKVGSGRWEVGSGRWEVGGGTGSGKWIYKSPLFRWWIFGHRRKRGSYITQMVMIKKPHSDTCGDVLAVFLKEEHCSAAGSE